MLNLITNVDFRVISSNISRGVKGVFSYTNSPHFPVAEAVAMSMCIPGAFKPIFVKNHNQNFDSQKIKSGFYGDGGMLDNFSINIFDKNKNGEYKLNTLGFMVTDGPAKSTNCESPEFTRDKNKKYIKYVDGFFDKEARDLPDIVHTETCMEDEIGKIKHGFSLLEYTGKILDMFLNYSTKRRFEDENLFEINVIEVFSFNVGMFNFSPEADYEKYLFEFIVDEAYLITKKKLNL